MIYLNEKFGSNSFYSFLFGSCENKDSFMHNTTIFGHVSNKDGYSANMVLIKVFKYHDGTSPSLIFADNTDADGNYKLTFLTLSRNKYAIVTFGLGGSEAWTDFLGKSYKEINLTLQ